MKEKIIEIINKMNEDSGKKYSIMVKSRPPVKGNSTDENKKRKEILRKEAKKQLNYTKPKWTNLKLKVNYYNGQGGDDSLNVQGGIADALQGIAYDNDRQVLSSTMDEHFLAKDASGYIVELEFLEPGLTSHNDEFEEKFI